MDEASSTLKNLEINLPTCVCYVNSKEDETVVVAMDVKIQGQTIRWFDTVKERMMTLEQVINNDPVNFSFRRAQNEGGATYVFVPMTLEIYNKKVKSRLLSAQDFTDEEEMFRAFEKTRENAW